MTNPNSELTEVQAPTLSKVEAENFINLLDTHFDNGATGLRDDIATIHLELLQSPIVLNSHIGPSFQNALFSTKAIYEHIQECLYILKKES